MPFFSVVIPLYNKQTYIKNTLESVLNQSFKDFEVIIVDDGSTDNSYSIISQFDDSRIEIIQQLNCGVSKARNNGILAAKSKYIALLDADDLWKANHLFELKKQIDLFPNAELYCNNYEIYYSEKIIKKAIFNFDFNNESLIVRDYFSASLKNSVAWTSSVCFSKEKFIEIGQFNINYTTAQDLDLWIRFALAYKISFNPTITMSYRYYIKNSLSKDFHTNVRYNFLTSYLNKEHLNPSLKNYMNKKKYGFALECKIHNNMIFYTKIIQHINFNNLNFKQKILLKLPYQILKPLNHLRTFLLKNNLYLRFFKQ